MKSFYRKIFSFSVLQLTVYISLAHGQAQVIISNTSCTTAICTTLINQQVTARDKIIIQPKTSIQATPNNESRLYINKTIQVPVSYQSSVNYSNVIPPIDFSFPVGSTPGQASVTPSGQATYNIPIVVPPGTKGMQPSINIYYNSGSPEGIVGRGWNINSLSVIARVPKEEYYNCIKNTTNSAYYRKGIQLNNTDAYALDGMRMIFSGTSSAYRLENDNFSKITPLPNNSTPTHFIVETKDGITMEYGTNFQTQNSQLVLSNPSSVTFAWYLSKVSDKFGNYILYIYDKNTTNNEVWLKEIQYTGNTIAGSSPYNSIKFYYDMRTDQTTRYILNNPLKNTLVLREIEISCEGNFMKRYQFKYGYDSQTFLNEIIEQGSDFTKLNSTFIKYGENVTQANTVSTTLINAFTPSLISNADYYAGDFNGDGRSDLLAFQYSSISPVGIRTYTGWKLFLNSDDGSHYTTPDLSSTPLPSNFLPYTISEYFTEWGPTPSGIQTYDINADGMDDAIIGQKVNHDIFYTVYLSTGNPASWFSAGATFYMDETSKLVLADIDGDGKPEGIEYRYNPQVSNDHLFRIFWFETGNCALINRIYDENPGNNVVPAGYNGFTPIDFDGDGIQELMTARGIKKVILKLSITPGCISSTCWDNCSGLSPHESREIWSESFGVVSIGDYTQNSFGDFNGDGITDIVKISSPYNAGNQSARIFLGTGTGFANPQLISGMFSFSVNSKYLVADINNDGKSDLIQMIKVPGSVLFYVCYGGQFTITYLGTVNNVEFPDNQDYFLNNLDTPPPTAGGDDGDQSNDSYPTDVNAIPEFLVGDFDGDGRTDIFFKTSNSGGARMIAYINKGSTKHLANTISDGFRLNTNFRYATMANGGSNVYMKGSGSLYPLADVQMPSYVVKEFTLPDGIGGSSTTSYKYEGATVHLQGKGFLGFDKVTANNAVTNRKIENTYSYINSVNPPTNASLYEKVPSVTKTFLISPSIPVSEESYTTGFQTIVSGCGRALSHFTKTTQIISKNLILGTKVIEDLTYDASGNVTQSVIKITDINNINNTPPFLEITTVDCNFISAGNWGPSNVAEKCTTTAHRNEDTNPVDYVRIVHNSYNTSDGNLTQTIQDPGKAKRLQMDYTLYDANTGVLKQMVVSDPGSASPTSKTVNYGYDNFSRFITQTTNPIGQNSFAAYDPKWGKPLTETGIDGLVTKYQYDGYGRIKNLTTPDNLTVSTTYDWIQPGSLNAVDYTATTFGSDVVSNALYSISSQRPGSPASRTIYDIYSRELASDVDGFNNKIFSANKYDARGNIFKQCGDYENTPGALLPVVTTNSYNPLNQLFKSENIAGTVTNTTNINYFYNNDGTERIETTLPDGKLFKKTTDASGLLISTQDDGGILTYSYYHDRQLKETKLDGVSTNTIEYDEYGRQSKLTEANSGTTEYIFSAYDELVYQKDARNNIITMEYNDPLGRITVKRCTTASTGAVTNYDYNYVTSGNGLNMLQSVLMWPVPNNNLYTYTYDNLNRLTKEDKIINNGTSSQHFVTNYEYDQFSNLQKETHPGGFVVKHIYDANGYHKQIIRDDNNEIIWRLDEMNALEQYTKYTSHPQNNPVQTIKMYDNFGFPSSFFASSVQSIVQDLQFTFNPASGNLMNRTDGIHNLTESFTYDQSGRLKTSTSQGLSVDYFPNGNIKNKSDAGAGDYEYADAKPNAVVKLPSPAIPNISINQQNITYTFFNKTEKIIEDIFDLRFAYGPYDERVTTELRVNSNITERRYYSNDYEITFDAQNGNTLSEINYISCGAGLVAMFVKDNVNPNGKIYFPYLDHLGSLLKVTDENGTTAVEQSFDAWGRNRNPIDWSYNNMPSAPAWLNRGYTGHEHLPEFVLINMNGRMYDPVVGRMLSPDNNLQAPDYSQNHNRYSYALNNPLKFTDPTGMRYKNSVEEGSSWGDYSTATDLAIRENMDFESVFDSDFDREHFRYLGSHGPTTASGINFSMKPVWTGDKFQMGMPEFNREMGMYGYWGFPDVIPYTESSWQEGTINGLPTWDYISETGARLENWKFVRAATNVLRQGEKPSERTPWVEDIMGGGIAGGLKGLFGAGVRTTETMAAKSGVQYTKSSLQIGQQMHKAYKVGEQGIKEFVLPSGRRIDFLDINKGIIYELKPFNPRAMQTGRKQMQIYLLELQTMPRFKGVQWKTVLNTY